MSNQESESRRIETGQPAEVKAETEWPKHWRTTVPRLHYAAPTRKRISAGGIAAKANGNVTRAEGRWRGSRS
jgi:hypothetical protein